MMSILTFIIGLTMFVGDEAKGYKVGDKAEDFKLKNIDEKMISMADFKDAKGFIVVFTCNHCPFSKKYEDRIVELDKKYKSMGYPVIAINPNDAEKYPDDSFENMKIRSKEKGFTFPYLHDESQAIATKYGAARTPHVYLLNKEDNSLVVRYIGAIDDNAEDASKVSVPYLSNAVDQLLKGEEVTTSETKAIGCTIKWKK